jgi:hypothetical protein
MEAEAGCYCHTPRHDAFVACHHPTHPNYPLTKGVCSLGLADDYVTELKSTKYKVSGEPPTPSLPISCNTGQTMMISGFY